MADRPRQILRRVLPGVVLGFVVLVALALFGDLKQVGRLVSQFQWKYFAFAIGFTLFNYTLRFFKWHFYLRQIGAHNISVGHSMRLFVAGFPLAVSPGKAAEVFKAIWVNRLTGLPVGKGVSVVLAERISDGMAVLLLSTVGVIAYPRYWVAFAVILALLVTVIVLSQVRPVALWLLGVGEKLPVVKRFAHELRAFYEGSYTLFKPGATLLAVGLGMISWLGEGVGFYLILIGLGAAPGWQVFSIAVFALSFSTVVGAVSALPGGLGAAEVSIAGMLTFLGGLETALASAATVLIRLATLWFGVSLGLAVWAFSRDLLGMESEHGNKIES